MDDPDCACRRAIGGLALLVAALGLVALDRPAPARAEALVPWTYDGARGPEAWGDLDPGFAACGVGVEQSPIDLVATHAGTPEAILPRWRTFAPTVVNNGHTIEVEVPAGSHTLFAGRRYELLQFHFHHPSEHSVDGNHAPLEAHFVHRSEDGDLLVLGVLLAPGEANDALETVWEVMPTAPGRAHTRRPLDPTRLLPEGGGVFRYAGSLTTPPCTEVVSWAVFERPVPVSGGQIAAFASLFPGNARPIQPRHRRFVLRGP